jgi:hypothetical protein
MKPRTQDNKARLADAQWELRCAQLDSQLCDVRKYTALIEAIKGMEPTDEGSA